MAEEGAPAEQPPPPPPAEGGEAPPPAEGVEGGEAAPVVVEGTPEPPPRKEVPDNFKVIYFNVKALAEPLRYLLSYGGIEFDDIRISREEWPALKATMPMGQMPVLECDGKRVHQTLTMCRYLAKIVKLNGTDAWEDMMIDIAADTVNDFRLKIAVVSYEPEDDVQEKKLQTLNQEVIPFYLEKLDQISKENNGFLALGRLTWADVYLAGILDYLNYLTKRDLVAEWPNLKQVIDNVTANENIKNWIERRPVTEV